MAAHPQLHPGQVPILFKNFMVEEIIKNGRGAKLELEKLTDIGNKR